MAKIIQSDVESQVIGQSYSFWKILTIGVLSGVFLWLFTIAINQYIAIPLFCNSQPDAINCLNSINISGNIAIILVAILGILMMLRFRIVQPLIAAVAAVITLWDLVQWTTGLSTAEIIFWNILLYGLAYLLFTWITRYRRTGISLIAIIVIILVARIVTNL